MRPRTASSTTKPDSDGVARASRRAAPGCAHELAVDARGVGVRDDDVGRQRPRARLDPVDPAARRRDARDARAGADDGAPLDGAGVDRLAEQAQPARHVPAALGLLDVRHRGERRRGPPRVRAGVGGVPVQHGAQPRVAQVPAAERAQRQVRGDGADVAGPGQGQPRDGAAARTAGSPGTAPGWPPRPGARARRTPASRRRRRATSAPAPRGARRRRWRRRSRCRRRSGSGRWGAAAPARARPASRRWPRTGRGTPAAWSPATARCRSGTRPARTARACRRRSRRPRRR